MPLTPALYGVHHRKSFAIYVEDIARTYCVQRRFYGPICISTIILSLQLCMYVCVFLGMYTAVCLSSVHSFVSDAKCIFKMSVRSVNWRVRMVCCFTLVAWLRRSYQPTLHDPHVGVAVRQHSFSIAYTYITRLHSSRLITSEKTHTHIQAIQPVGNVHYPMKLCYGCWCVGGDVKFTVMLLCECETIKRVRACYQLVPIALHSCLCAGVCPMMRFLESITMQCDAYIGWRTCKLLSHCVCSSVFAQPPNWYAHTCSPLVCVAVVQVITTARSCQPHCVKRSCVL